MLYRGSVAVFRSESERVKRMAIDVPHKESTNVHSTDDSPTPQQPTSREL